MLKDADFNYFPAVYVVCSYTDMRCGIDSLAAIIERKYKVNIFITNTLFPLLWTIIIKNKRPVMGRRWIPSLIQTC